MASIAATGMVGGFEVGTQAMASIAATALGAWLRRGPVEIHGKHMRLQLDKNLKTRIPGATFGVVTLTGLTVHERDERLWSLIEALCARRAREYRLGRLYGYEP